MFILSDVTTLSGTGSSKSVAPDTQTRTSDQTTYYYTESHKIKTIEKLDFKTCMASHFKIIRILTLLRIRYNN